MSEYGLLAAGLLQAMADILVGLVFSERFEVMIDDDALGELGSRTARSTIITNCNTTISF